MKRRLNFMYNVLSVCELTAAPLFFWSSVAMDNNAATSSGVKGSPSGSGPAAAGRTDAGGIGGGDAGSAVPPIPKEVDGAEFASGEVASSAPGCDGKGAKLTLCTGSPMNGVGGGHVAATAGNCMGAVAFGGGGGGCGI